MVPEEEVFLFLCLSKSEEFAISPEVVAALLSEQPSEEEASVEQEMETDHRKCF